MNDRAALPPNATTPSAQHARLLTALRGLWVLLAIGLSFFYVRGLLIQLRTPISVCYDAMVCTPDQANAFLERMGLNPGLVTGLQFVLLNLVSLSFLAAAAFIMWRGGNTAIALSTATSLLVYGMLAGNDVAQTGMHNTPFAYVTDHWGLALFACALVFTLFTFPDGRIVPRWVGGVLVVTWLVIVVVNALAGLESDPTVVVLLIIAVVGIGIQVYRYRRTSSAGQRQQAKWGILGLCGLLLNSVLWIGWVTPTAAQGVESLRVYLAFLPISMVLVLSWPVTLTIAVLRYRLCDIDVLIRRTLIYSALTAVLTFTYFGLVIGLQGVAGVITGQSNSALVTVLSTLAIAALFAPVRGRVQNFVDRRFYRRKYDTAQTLAAFAMQARDEVNLDQLSNELRGAVDEAMQPAHIGLWLKQ